MAWNSRVYFQGISHRPLAWASDSLEGSAVWRVLLVFYKGAITGLAGFRHILGDPDLLRAA